jgi:UDP-N-acetylmuramoyl-tripeptide--D-alanyl-D-alanine ligase
MNLKLHEILEIDSLVVDFSGALELLEESITEIGIDSRKSVPGGVYVALRGERLDGHQFTADAFARGCRAAIVDADGFESLGALGTTGNFFIVPDTTRALQEIAHFYRKKFSIPIVALTGTSGKTTTKEMLGAVLAQKFNLLKTAGNLNNHIGVPLTLLQLTRQHELALIEMGTNHFGEIQRLVEIAQPQSGLITNIGRGHLEFFGSVDGVARAKHELFDGLPPNGTAFINADDPRIVQKIPQVKRKVYYGLKNQAQIKGEIIKLNQEGEATFKVLNQEIRLPVPGIHNVYNALAAISVGLEFGMSLEQVQPVLETFRPHSKRMEVLNLGSLRIINDCYNSNPESLTAALDVLENMFAAGKKIVVLADMLELGAVAESEHRNIANLLAQLQINHVLGFGPLTEVLIRELKTVSEMDARHFADKTELVHFLKTIIAPGDLILIKGSRGMALETVLNDLMADVNMAGSQN